jgi:hypothetical protein
LLWRLALQLLVVVLLPVLLLQPLEPAYAAPWDRYTPPGPLHRSAQARWHLHHSAQALLLLLLLLPLPAPQPPGPPTLVLHLTHVPQQQMQT